ncbi:MAG TPA: hypothetical protein PLC40_19530, partial [Candidatus Hydrogenedentes bacterium]|nr:hypothetical protein [Candidatus Hydrogenedentota bacterium]
MKLQSKIYQWTSVVLLCAAVSSLAFVAMAQDGEGEDCDDGNPCTYDIYIPGFGCIHSQNFCNDDNACTLDVCDPMTGECL